MKVPGSEDTGDALRRIQEKTVAGEGAKQKRVNPDAKRDEAGRASAQASRSGEDKFIRSNLASQIRAELSPAAMLAERRAKIEALKEQISNGSYNPPVGDVARAVAEEVSTEIIFGQDAPSIG